MYFQIATRIDLQTLLPQNCYYGAPGSYTGISGSNGCDAVGSRNFVNSTGS